MAPKMFSEIDVKDITFTAPKSSRSGGKILNPELNGSRPVFQTALLPLAWNTTVRKNEDNGGLSCKLSLSFKNASDPDSVAFCEWAKALDALVLETAIKNRATWFPKNVDENKVRAYFFSSVKEPSDAKFSETFQPKINTKDVDPSSDDVNVRYAMDVKVFGEDMEPLDPSVLTGGTMCAAIVEFAYVWISATMFGPTFIVKQVLAFPKEEVTGFAFTMTPTIESHKRQAAEPESKKRRVDSGDEESNDGSDESDL